MNRERARIEAWNNLPNYPCSHHWLNALIVSLKRESKYTRTRIAGIGVMPVSEPSLNGMGHRCRI